MRKFLFILALITFSSLLFSCHLTPEKPIIVNKDTGRMIEQAKHAEVTDGKTLKETVRADEFVKKNVSRNNLIINIDADVFVPKGTEMSITRVAPGEYDQDHISAIWDELVGDTEMFYTPQVMTKTEIEALIINTKRLIEDCKEETDDLAWEIERLESDVEHLEALYDNAPEKVETVKASSNLISITDYSYNTHEYIEHTGITAQNKDGTVRFFVTNPFENLNGTHTAASIHYSRANTDYGYDGEAKITSCKVDVTDVNPPDDSDDLCSPKEAAEEVLGFITNTDLPFEIIPQAVSLDDDGVTKYYTFSLTRVVGDIPVAFVLGASHAPDDVNFEKPWFYESFIITVDKDGIRTLDWESPLSIKESLVDSSSLLTFSNIETIFDEMMFVKYAPMAKNIESLQLDIRHIRLEMMRVQEQNTEDQGLLVPVWDYYGTRIVRTEEGEELPTSENILLSINAIDGSIIDTSKGY